MFDADEYWHLALHAGSLGQHHACMTFLKVILQQQPGHAPAIYLLAAQHAELGLLERAVRGMKDALAIDPTIEMARVQLGLLQLDGHQRAEARENFAALSGSSDPAVRAFSDAMTAVADGQPTVARTLLAAALAQQAVNSGWSSLMRRLLDGPLQGEQAKTGASDAADGQVVLGAYRQLSS